MKKFYDKYSWLIILLLVLALVFLKNCNSEPKPPINLKPEIKLQDSFRTVIRYKDSVRIKQLVKWSVIKKEVENDSTPCGNEIRYIVQEADTIIRIDSSEISSLKNLVSVDSIIQKKQAKQIDSLTHKLKWQKIKTKLILAGWVIREAVGIGAKIAK